MITVSNCDNNDTWNEFLYKEKANQMITIAHNPSLGPILSKTFGYKYQNLLIKDKSKIVSWVQDGFQIKGEVTNEIANELIDELIV